MFLVVGLGNPGEEYVHTRHNAGFMAIDVLAERTGGNYWKHEAGALTCKARFEGKELLLAKPQTFMNLSGAAVGRLCESYGLAPSKDLIVVADELDLPAGEVRVKHGGGHAGHNGHRSIIGRLATPDYCRIRIGIGRPPGRMDASDYVLQRVNGEAFEALRAACELAADRVLDLLTGRDRASM
jgi:PTH1 family peptidyl-tRNA hydrolase